MAVFGTVERVLPISLDVGEGGQVLQRAQLELDEFPGCTLQRVRVVGFFLRQWHVDPSPATIGDDFSWRLWAGDNRPLLRLQWDPGEWFWWDPYAAVDSPGTPFFQYTARLGRRIQRHWIDGTPAAAKHWWRQGISPAFLRVFWQRLWDN